MGIMNKMRDNTAVILWILVIAFGGIWVFSDSGALDVIGKDNGLYVGSVDGESLKREDFEQMLNNMEQRASQNGQTLTSSMRDQMSDAAFNALVEKVLLERECRRLGIQVTDAEVSDMIFGANPDPLIAQAFGDAQGNINRTALNNFWNSPQQRAQVIQIQNAMREKRMQDKLNALLSSTANVSLADAREEYARRNQKYSAEYIALPVSQIDDKSIKTTDADLTAYYNAHKEEFKRKKSYTFDFVSASTSATPQDSARVKGELGGLATAFQQATNNALFLLQNQSSTPYDSNYVSRSTMDPKLASAVFSNLAVGRIVGPLSAGKDVHLVKITGIRANKTGGMVRASHILVDDLAKANALLAQLKGGADFTQLAAQNSKDGSSQQGGDLGWANPSKYVAEFKTALENGPIGLLPAPVKTQFGYHIIKITGRDNQEVQLADLSRNVEVGAGGIDKLRKKMEDFQYFAEENKNFKNEANKQKLLVQSTSVEEGSPSIPLVGTSRELMNFLASSSQGKISKEIVLDDKIVVAQLTQSSPEGYKSMAEVKTLIEPKVRLEKKQQILVDKFKAAMQKNGFGSGLATALGTTLATLTDQSFNNATIQNLGLEPKFLGTALALQTGKVSGIIAGENGVYVLKVTNKTGPDGKSAPAAELDAIRQEQQKAIGNNLRQRWMENLKKKADIVDNRKTFGR
jgi:peptidylprolyl isomerase/peptidyl-prolyl cis-trans isomerase D